MKEIESRKADHIQISLEEEVSYSHNQWDDVMLIHQALPEVNLEEIDTTVHFLGKKLSFPLIITAITGGYDKAELINKNLAEACERLQIGLGIGSQRAAIEEGEEGSYSIVKDYDIPLRIGNIGAPQLISQKGNSPLGMEEVYRAMEMMDAHCIAVHLNFLQEVVQPEGDTNAAGCLEAIRQLSREIPVIAKETGAGISRSAAMKLKGAGVVAIDISGAGGTSFSAVEMFRALKKNDEVSASLGRTFRDWGIPAPVSLLVSNVGLPLIASGGIRNGLDVARTIVLGAGCAGMARPLLRAALTSADEVEKILRIVQKEFRAAMFLTGCSSVDKLRKVQPVIIGKTKEWLDNYMEGVF